LQELTRVRAPLGWATTQNNLRVALKGSASESETARLEEPVAAFREAWQEIYPVRATPMGQGLAKALTENTHSAVDSFLSE
jgi:hypothetical protein